MLLVGSPSCTSWINEAKRDPELVRREYIKAMEHLRFVCMLYKIQAEAGRFFLHEHPVAASSWKDLCISEVLNIPGVRRVDGDQCQLGQQTENGDPVKKPTGWMSNAEEVLHMLRERCGGHLGKCTRRRGGVHRSSSGRVAKLAAIYPFDFCEAMLQGFRNQLRKVGSWR